MVCFIFVCFLWVLVGMVLDIYLKFKDFFFINRIVIIVNQKVYKEIDNNWFIDVQIVYMQVLIVDVKS